MWGIFHVYDEWDGDNRNIHERSELVAVCDDYEIAKEWATKNSISHIFDRNERDVYLTQGTLVVEEIPMVITKDNKDVKCPWSNIVLEGYKLSKYLYDGVECHPDFWWINCTMVPDED